MRPTVLFKCCLRSNCRVGLANAIKNIAFGFILSCCMISCDKDDQPEDLLLGISLETIQMNHTKDASLVIVTASADWDVHTDADWIHLSTYQGKGEMGFIVGADANHSFSRESVVILKSGKQEQTIRVRQSACPVREISVKEATIRFLLVDSGAFLTGSNHHPVRLSEYYIAETELTNAVWKLVMDTLPGRAAENPDWPVSNVDWNTISQKFLPAINQITGLTFRLPTEAQWEFAARGGIRSKRYLYSGSNELSEVGWSFYAYEGTRFPVALKKANELGLYDMSGNVEEWCSDWYDEEYGVTALNDTLVNPTGPATGTEKVVKGGSFAMGMNGNYDAFKPQSRYSYPPDGAVLAGNKVDYVRVVQEAGFRLVISNP